MLVLNKPKEELLKYGFEYDKHNNRYFKNADKTKSTNWNLLYTRRDPYTGKTILDLSLSTIHIEIVDLDVLYDLIKDNVVVKENEEND
jgi:hypothetical protein